MSRPHTHSADIAPEDLPRVKGGSWLSSGNPVRRSKSSKFSLQGSQGPGPPFTLKGTALQSSVGAEERVRAHCDGSRSSSRQATAPDALRAAASLWETSCEELSFRLSQEALDCLSLPLASDWTVSRVVSHCLSFAEFLRRGLDASCVAPGEHRQPLYASLAHWLHFNATLAAAPSSAPPPVPRSSASPQLQQKPQGIPALKEAEAVALWGVAAALASLHTRRHARWMNWPPRQQPQRPCPREHSANLEDFPSLYYCSAAEAAASAAGSIAILPSAKGVSGKSFQSPDAALAGAGALLDAQKEVVEIRTLSLLLLLYAARHQQRQQPLSLPEDHWHAPGTHSPRRSSWAGGAGAPSCNEEATRGVSLPLLGRQHSGSRCIFLDSLSGCIDRFYRHYRRDKTVIPGSLALALAKNAALQLSPHSPLPHEALRVSAN
ncbi:hypothetical protein cyc_01897 [Cyclospora cayetanensis]|uniref:Uncharacterized protein n=1 Tax=Cyclospora cayetanensis TaxID=88456 RepID=A0A1D3CSR9_9EIME|nr:hypothetical protein cyc_01897 [Cyclospora cayetanensis]